MIGNSVQTRVFQTSLLTAFALIAIFLAAVGIYGGSGFMGFSASGHLGATMGMVGPEDARPNFLVLGYPAIHPRNFGGHQREPRTLLVAAAADAISESIAECGAIP